MTREAQAALAMFGVAMVFGGVWLTELVSGGRGRFSGWFLDERARRKRKARVLRRYPRVGRWIQPAGYAIAVTGATLFAWIALSAVL